MNIPLIIIIFLSSRLKNSITRAQSNKIFNESFAKFYHAILDYNNTNKQYSDTGYLNIAITSLLHIFIRLYTTNIIK